MLVPVDVPPLPVPPVEPVDVPPVEPVEVPPVEPLLDGVLGDAPPLVCGVAGVVALAGVDVEAFVVVELRFVDVARGSSAF